MKSGFLIVIAALALTLSACTKEQSSNQHADLPINIEGTAENAAGKYVEALFSGDVNQYLDVIKIDKQLSKEQLQSINRTDLINSFEPYITSLKQTVKSNGGIKEVVCDKAVFNDEKTTANVYIVIKFKDPNKSDHKEIVKVNKTDGQWLPALSQ